MTVSVPRRLVAFGVAALEVAFAACTSGQTTETSTTQAPETSDATLPRGENVELLTDLLEEVEGSREATFSVTYDLYAPDLVGGDTGAFTLAQDPPEKASRFVADGETKGVAFIRRDADVVACALSVGTWRCFGAQGIFENAPAVLDYSDVLSVLDAYRANQRWFSFDADSREIAGVQADCVVATGHEDVPRDVERRVGSRATLCVAPSGVPLLIEYTANDGQELLFRANAVSYSEQPKAELFDPPASVEAGPPNVTIPVPVPPEQQENGAG